MSEPFYVESDFSPQRSLGYLLKYAGKLITTQAEDQFSGSELSFTQWVALKHLNHGMADSCASLARSLGHDSGAMTRLVDGLEERGLLVRTRGGCDRRVVRVSVTEAGVAMLATATPRIARLWNALLADFRHEEVETLITLLRRLIAALEANDAGSA